MNMKNEFKYTDERNVQIVIELLKKHGIKRVIASPGTTNMTFVVSIENDPWFQIWSSVDERSAAYLACGMAAETGEPVVISCTGATASRNYMPGLTEAYYRKLPVLAITSTRGNHRIGHLIDQQIDRRNLPNDIAMESVTIPMVKDKEDERMCEIEANKAILALKLNGGGPAHINLYTRYSKNFSVEKIPHVNAIFRHTLSDKIDLPELPQDGPIAVYIGSHANCSDRLTQAIDAFCATYNAVVFCDHTSGYRGKYEVHYQLVCAQEEYQSPNNNIHLCIHIGEVSGDPYHIYPKHTWRVSPDGALRDTFGTLRRVFMMSEEEFFEKYAPENGQRSEFLAAVNQEVEDLQQKIPDLPFSNIWMAQQMVSGIPQNSELHLGIYHSLRSWDFFKLPAGVQAKCNVGGFGIDGGVSSMIGASLANPQKTFIGIFGDLAFFYDMNVIGNRHVGNNVRILLINNGRGNEFRNYNHPCYFLGDEADQFVAGAGHYGNKSPQLIKDYATNLGYEYLTANNKNDFLKHMDYFLSPTEYNKPIIFEVFTEKDDESNALEQMMHIKKQTHTAVKENIKKAVKDTIGEHNIKKIKTIINILKE